nr:MAG TPA: hypothetical protein [Crassvirales sp.]
MFNMNTKVINNSISTNLIINTSTTIIYTA